MGLVGIFGLGNRPGCLALAHLDATHSHHQFYVWFYARLWVFGSFYSAMLAIGLGAGIVLAARGFVGYSYGAFVWHCMLVGGAV